ncbi:MAG: RNA methyltransferase [Ignavibacteriales bacterium]|nr:RNA methyltransferase [Ignavibacteriales bacterium]
MENIHDPHNVSAMLRSCDAAGVMEVQLVYTDEEFPDVGKKSSASAKRWMERRKFESIDDCYAKLRKEGFFVYATRIDEKAKSLYDLDLRRKTAFVFGNEHRGVSDGAVQMADAMVAIPMFGMIESLNVSVACAVILFESVRQRLAAGHYAKTKMTDLELKKLVKSWAMKD